MDEIAQYNSDRWDALARARAVFTRPRLDLTAHDAQMLVDPERRFGEIAGKQVLCLAGGGGQQSAAFALLGAVVTVFDLSAAQLQRDRQAAAHYNLQVRTEQGDMRDLARFEPGIFDIVYQPYSLNFVPDVGAVFRAVARVTHVGGIYGFNCANPFLAGLTAHDWNGTGYPLSRPYLDGAEINYADEPWVFRGERPRESIPGPREYRHTLSTLVNGLCGTRFRHNPPGRRKFRVAGCVCCTGHHRAFHGDCAALVGILEHLSAGRARINSWPPSAASTSTWSA